MLSPSYPSRICLHWRLSIFTFAIAHLKHARSQAAKQLVNFASGGGRLHMPMLYVKSGNSDLAYTFHCQVLVFSVVAGFLLITEIQGEKASNT